MSGVGIFGLLAGSAALVTASVFALHNQNDTVYKPIAIAGSASEVVGFGLFLFDQTRGSPSSATTAVGSRVAAFSLSWPF